MYDKNNVEIKGDSLVRMSTDGVDWGMAYYRGGYFEFEDGQCVPQDRIHASWLTVIRQ